MVASDCFVSVVAPLRDDADIVEGFVEDTLEVLKGEYANYELVLVDDGSRDGTVGVVEGLLRKHGRMRLIRLSRSFGQEIAISAGLDSVIGDFTAVLLPDMDPPDKIPEMVARSREGAGVVFGIRSQRHGEPWLLRTGATLFYGFCARVLKLSLPRNSTHFRVLSRQAVNALTQIKDRGRYLRTLSQYVGYENQGFVYDPIERRSPPRRKSLLEALGLAVNVIVANTTNPLRVVSFLGMVVASLNLLYMVWVVGLVLFKERLAEGWVTRSMQDSLMFFFLFVILAILCEYVGRLLAETSGRPLYYVLEERNSQGLPEDAERRNVVTEAWDGAPGGDAEDAPER